MKMINLLLLLPVILFSQSMIIHQDGGDKSTFTIADIDSITFDMSEPSLHPLVGIWDFTDYRISATYIAKDSSFAPLYVPGDTIADGLLDWTILSMLGVDGYYAINEDRTFTFTGSVAILSDTLGLSPMVVPLTDAGTWTVPENYTTIILDGAFYDMGGLLTLNDPEDPTQFSMEYNSVMSEAVVVPIMMDSIVYLDAIVEVHIHTYVQLTRRN